MESRFNVVSVENMSGKVDVITSGSFKEFNLTEENVEKLLSSGVMLKGDIKIIGRQVAIPEYRWRIDLVGLRKDGALVIIEVKRDREDMERRQEPCEMQVIRYAACLFDTIRTVDDLLDRMYVDFASKNVVTSDSDTSLRTEIIRDDLKDDLVSWLHPSASINHKQELVLVASGFDAGTLLACEWLYNRSQSKVLITCIQVSPFRKSAEQLLLIVDKVFPVATVKEMAKKQNRAAVVSGGDRSSFMSTSEMFDNGLIEVGQTIYLKGTDAKAEIVDGVMVKEGDKLMRWNEWAKSHKSGSFSLYQYVCVNSPKGKTLHELRMGQV